jgi:ferrous iron transport protein B
LLYFPCIAVVLAIARETNWRWSVFSIIYTTGTAWLVSFLVFQIGSLF